MRRALAICLRCGLARHWPRKRTNFKLVAAEPIVLKHPAIADNYDNRVSCLVFAGRDTLLATGAASGVFIWDVTKGELRQTLKVDQRGVDSLAIDPRGGFLVAGGASGIIKVWETQTWKELRSLGPTTGAVRTLAISPDGKLLASASPSGQGAKDYGIILWDLSTGQKLRTLSLPPPSFGATVVSFTPDGQTIIAAQDRAVRVLDVHTGKELRSIPLRGVTRSLGSLALRSDGRRLVTGIFEPRIRLWDTETWEQLLAWDAHDKDPPPRHGVASVAYSPDGQVVLSGGMDGMVCLWQASSGRKLLQLDARIQSSQGWVSGVKLSSDGSVLAASHTSGTAMIWRISMKAIQ